MTVGVSVFIFNSKQFEVLRIKGYSVICLCVLCFTLGGTKKAVEVQKDRKLKKRTHMVFFARQIDVFW